MSIQFGKLQAIKAKNLSAKTPDNNIQKANAQKAESIFQEYEKYKNQLSQAQENGGETGSSTAFAFGSTSISVTDLQAKMKDCENEFQQYYAMMNEKPEQKNENNKENEDEKNKVKPKQFGSLMA